MTLAGVAVADPTIGRRRAVRGCRSIPRLLPHDQFELVRVCLVFLAVFTLWTAAQSARAAVIEVTAIVGEAAADADARTILFGGDEFDADNASDSASSFADFPLNVEAGANTSQAGANAGAILNASMVGNGFSADGSAEALAYAADFNSANASGQADLSITFSLDRRLGYRLEWGFSVFGENNIGMGSISLRDPGGVIFSVASPGIPPGNSGAEIGVLEAGEYVLRGIMSAGANAPGLAEHVSASGSFTFEFRVVPEPSSVVLMGLGLAAMCTYNCRRD